MWRLQYSSPVVKANKSPLGVDGIARASGFPPVGSAWGMYLKALLPWHLALRPGYMESNFGNKIERFLPGLHCSQMDELAPFASIILELRASPGAWVFVRALTSMSYTVCGSNFVWLAALVVTNEGYGISSLYADEKLDFTSQDMWIDNPLGALHILRIQRVSLCAEPYSANPGPWDPCCLQGPVMKKKWRAGEMVLCKTVCHVSVRTRV